MDSKQEVRRGTPLGNSCDSYHVGHNIHYIQWNLSRGNGQGEPRTIDAVTDDGTITFTIGEPVWNHDPERLRTALDLHGREVHLIAPGVLRVHGRGGTYACSVAAAPSPCLSDTQGDHTGESFAEETLRRGGALRDGRLALAELDKLELGDGPES